MATGSYWNVDDPLKPYGLLDPQEVKHIPFDFSEWLAGEGATYAAEAIASSAELTATKVGESAGVVMVSVSATGAASEGDKYSVTVLLTASDGQKKSQTLFFKIKEL